MHILVVEDQHRIAAYVRRGLEEEGHAVDVAYRGDEAFTWAAGVPFDLIVLDVMLPDMDGVEVCRRLRERGVETPILMLTARDAVDDRVVGLDAGADDYLTKPFALKELHARVRALSRRSAEGHRDPIMRVADLSMDPRTRRVERAGRLVRLTAKEYAVLECLLREKGRVLTRTQIADHVWNYDVFNHSNVVDVYIRNLRRKIDADADAPLIHTVRGAGYRLSETP